MRYFIIIFLLTTQFLASQDKIKLTLNECINLAQQQSPSAKIALNNKKNKVLYYEAFNAGLLPQINLSGNIPGLSRRISQIRQNDGTFQFKPISQLNSSGGLLINQTFASTGTQISLFSGLTKFDQLENNEFSQWGATPFQVAISQPIFQFNSLFWDSEIQELKFSKTNNEFIEDMENISKEATQKFFDIYIAQMNLKNAEFNVATNDTLFMLSKGRFNVGKIAENDLLQSELALLNAENDLENAKLEYNKAIEELKMFLNLEKDAEFELIAPLSFKKVTIPIDLAVKEAIKNRPTIVDLDIKKLEAERNLNSVERKYGFNATISAGFGYNQSAEQFNNAYKNLFVQQDINLNIEIPLFLWGKSSAEIEAAMIAQDNVEKLNEQEIKKFEIDVNYQVSKFNLLQKQVELSQKAYNIASRRFDVAKNRYIIGKIDLTQLFIAQSEKDNAFRAFIHTLKNYWISYYEMRKLTLYDFEKNEPISY